MSIQNMLSNQEDGIQKKHNIVITGFGLFRDHKSNPSWEAIRDKRLAINRPDVNIITKEINVEYKEVDNVVNSLWKEFQPLLMIHVGLAAHEQAIRIEQFARHGPYIHDDVAQDAPHKDLRVYDTNVSSKEENVIQRSGYTCRPLCKFDCDKTCIDVDKICQRIDLASKDKKTLIPVRKSHDAGLYVCEYIYHKSLQICERTVFIHVPDITNFKLEQISETLSLLIETIVDELIQIGDS